MTLRNSKAKPNLQGVAASMVLILVTGCTASQEEATVSQQYSTNAFSMDNRSHVSQPMYQLQHARSTELWHKASALHHAVNTWCLVEPEAITEPWHSAMASWMALQGQERGPQQALEQNWSMQFWPDKKNTLGRQMRELLKNEPYIDPSELANRSVTVQGLGAVEWLLFDPAAQASSAEQRCVLMASISAHTVSTASTMASAWQQNPWLELDNQQWQQEMFSMVNNQLDFMLKKLSLPLAKIGKPNPYFAESWRSQTSYSNLKANLQQLQSTLMVEGGIVSSLEAIDSPVASRISEALAQTIEQWPSDDSLFEQLPTKSGYRQALNAFNQLDYLNYLLTQEASQALGVTIGFNATDGD